MTLIVCLLWLILAVVGSSVIPLNSFANFKYGQLSIADIHSIADNLPIGRLQGSIEWLARSCELFSFSTHDGLTLQGYFIPADDLNRTSASIVRPIVFSSGWTESTIRNAPALRDLHALGQDIYAFDLRGQGFSESALLHSRTGRKISHVKTFSQFVDDLELFLSTIMPQHFHKRTNNRYADSSQFQVVPSYVGFSLSGLIGLSLAQRNPSLLGPQNHMVLLSPCIRPLVGTILSFTLQTLRYFGLDEMLLLEVQLDDPKAKLTHSSVNAQQYFALLNMVPQQLKVVGPSVSLLNEMVLASDALMKAAPTMSVDLLIIQAEQDYLVDNAAQNTFMAVVGSEVKSTKNCARDDSDNSDEDGQVCSLGDSGRPNVIEIMKDAYHVLIDEEEHIYTRMIELMRHRLQ